MVGSAIVAGNGVVLIEIPDGGAAGEVLTKLSADPFDFDWLPGGGGGGTIIIEDEGVVVGVPADTLDFVGAGVTASGAGTTKTITIPGGASTLQAAYDAATAVPQITVVAGDPLTIDLAVAANDVFALRDAANVDLLRGSDTRFTFDNAITYNSDPAKDQTTIRVDSTFSVAVPYIGGAFTHTGAITYSNSVFINSTFGELVTYTAGTAPGFAAYTMMQGLPNMTSGAGFDLVNVIGINMGPTGERATAGTSVQANVFGFSYAAQTRALVAGAVMTRTTQTVVAVSPTFSTVAGSTANLGTIIGIQINTPAAALFQPSAGVETVTAIYGINYNAMAAPAIGSDNVVVRSNLQANAAHFFLNNLGGAQSNFGAGTADWNDGAGVRLGTGDDVLLNWNGSSLEFDPAVGDDMRISFAVNTHTIVSASASEDSAINFNYPKGAFGEGGAPGNNKYRFVANAETITIGGEFTQFLLTQSANDTIDAALSLYAGWTINSPTPTIGTGSLTTAVGLNVGGNPGSATVNRVGVRIISNPAGGSGINAALWVTAGLSRFDGRVDINNGIALGGGAVATLGTIGLTGPTAAAQAQWMEVDIGGVAHWIPVWV